MITPITVSQLPDSPPNYVMLRCSVCGAEYSANRGDYFLLSPDESITCECGFELFIVSKRTIYDHDKGSEWLQ